MYINQPFLDCTVLQDHSRGGGGVQGADGLLCGLLLHPRREADQGPALQVAHTISLYTYLLSIFYTILSKKGECSFVVSAMFALKVVI